MNQEAAVCRVIDALEKLGIGYMLVGAYSSNAWGIPRATKDADFVLGLDMDPPESLFSELGEAFEIDPQLSFETKTGSLRWTVHNKSPRFMIELFLLTKDDHHQARFQRKVRAFLDDIERDAWIPTAEDVIIQKVRWARPKDQQDVLDIMSVQGDALDWPYIESWCDLHGTRALLEELKAAVPPDL